MPPAMYLWREWVTLRCYVCEWRHVRVVMVTGDVIPVLLREYQRHCCDGWLMISNLGYRGYDRTFLCVTLEVGLIGFCGFSVSGNSMWISWRPVICIHILTLPNAIVTDRKAPHKSNSAQVATEHRHCHPYIQGSPAESQHTGKWSAAAHDRPRRLYYRPTVFFRHVRLTTISLQQANGRRGFQKCYYFGFLI